MKTEREEKKERERATDRFYAGEVAEVKLSWMRRASNQLGMLEFLVDSMECHSQLDE